MFSWRYKNYPSSKKASICSSFLYSWPLNIVSWVFGPLGVLLYGFLAIRVGGFGFVAMTIFSIVLAAYAFLHKGMLEKAIIKYLYRDCPEIFNEDELAKLNEGTREGLKDVVKSFKNRNERFI